MGDTCPLKAGVGINSHFDPWSVTKQWIEHYFGFYDFALGIGLKLIAGPAIL